MRNLANEQIKQTYFEFLKHVDGKSPKTIIQHEKSILKFEKAIGFKNFKTFDQKQAIAFKGSFNERRLSISTIASTINQVKRFFGWLRLQHGYKRSIKDNDIGYLNLSDKDKRAASAPADKHYPSLKLIERVVEAMPHATAIEMRDRALIAFTAITGIRDGATISLKLKHFDISQNLVLQNPKEVATKASKRIDTFIFPLSKPLEKVFLEWVQYLRNDLVFSNHAPLFPRTAVKHDENQCFAASGISKEHWTSATAMRAIFRKAFEAVGEEYYGPHSFRHMIVSEAYTRTCHMPNSKLGVRTLGMKVCWLP